jgi:hypothetical protein
MTSCQEDKKDKISFECLRTTVDDAIKTKDISIIEGIEKKNLRYVQKYIEMHVSEKGLGISLNSYDIGLEGVILAFIAIGGSFVLFGISRETFIEGAYLFLGIIIASLGAWLWYKGRHIKRKENEKIEEDIEFMHKIILRIEERITYEK